MKHFLSGKIIAFDTETTGLHPWRGDQPYTYSFCNEALETKVFEWPVDPFTRQVVPVVKELRAVRRILRDPSITKVGHHIKFDWRMTECRFGFTPRGPIHDTMFLSHCCDCQAASHRLKDLAYLWLRIPADDETELQAATLRARRMGKSLGWTLGTETKFNLDGTKKYDAATKADYWMPRVVAKQDETVPRRWLSLSRKYARRDALRTMLLFQFFLPLLDELEGARKAYDNELNLWGTTYRMESRGVGFSLTSVNEEIKKLQAMRVQEHNSLQRVAWSGFDPAKHRDIRALLVNQMRLPLTIRTKTGLLSVKKEALEPHRSNPVVASLQRHASAVKGLTTFLYQYRDKAVKSAQGLFLHPDFRQVGPLTRRYACADPNLQQAADSNTGRSLTAPLQVRVPFGPRRGHRWWLWDYEQLEVRIYAHCAQEPTMIKALLAGRNVHDELAQRIFGGEGNPSCTRSAIDALEFDIPTDEVPQRIRDEWKKIGVTAKQVTRLRLEDQKRLAESWVRQFGYRIVEAEESLGKKKYHNRAKMLVFNKLFCGGPKAVVTLAQCTLAEATQLLREMDIAFPRMGIHSREVAKRARLDGFVLTVQGYRINVDPEYAYRGVNYEVQGSAAGHLKRAMLRFDRHCRSRGLSAHIVMTIHDELVTEWRKGHDSLGQLQDIASLLEDHDNLFCVPIKVKCERVVQRWNEKETIKLC